MSNIDFVRFIFKYLRVAPKNISRLQSFILLLIKPLIFHFSCLSTIINCLRGFIINETRLFIIKHRILIMNSHLSIMNALRLIMNMLRSILNIRRLTMNTLRSIMIRLQLTMNTLRSIMNRFRLTMNTLRSIMNRLRLTMNALLLIMNSFIPTFSISQDNISLSINQIT